MTRRHGSQRATIVQVAELAGVSIKTVSRVTNGEPHVRPELRRRVQSAIGRLGYQPMQSARSLPARRSGLVALVYDNPSPGYLVRVQAAARRCCEEHGLRLLFHPCDHRDAHLPESLVRLASDLRLEGVVLVPPVSLDDGVVQSLEDAGVPTSLLAPAQAQPGACAVLLDDQEAAHTLANHIMALGHRRIGFVRGHPDHEASRARLAGYRLALREAGLAFDASLLVAGDFSFASGRSAGAALLDRPARPTAVIASNDDMAAGVMAAALDRGISIPAGVAVCGFDDSPLASMLWPPLTTMRQPIGQMAYEGTRMLIGRMNGESAPPAARLAHQLVVRGSTSLHASASGEPK